MEHAKRGVCPIVPPSELLANTTKRLAACPSEEYVDPREINRVDREDGAKRRADSGAVTDGYIEGLGVMFRHPFTGKSDCECCCHEAATAYSELADS